MESVAFADQEYSNYLTQYVVKFSEMATKYDTNPLDPDFPAKAKTQAEQTAATQVLGVTGAETQRFGGAMPIEEQTRRFAEADVHAYQQPLNGHYVPAQYQASQFAAVEDSSKRKIEKVGLPENIVIALPYFPWFLGMVAGAVLLFLLPKSETKARFHAAQGLAAHVGILIVTTILGMIGNVTDLAEVANVAFQIATTIMLIVFAVKAWKGKPVHIESVDTLTNWFEEKIDSKIFGS